MRDEGGVPERVVRTAAMVAATLGAFAPLGVETCRRGLDGVRDAGLCGLVLLLAAYASLQAEASPEELDSPPARRARRFAPFAVGVAVAGLLVFPWYALWGLPTLLFFANLPLVAFWHVTRVRAVSLLVATIAALASSVIVEAAAWSLLPVGLAWALVPAFDRAAATRALLEPRPRPRPGPPLAAGLAVVAAGALVFAAATAVLPPSTRAFTTSDLMKPRPGAFVDPPKPPDIPLGPLTILLAACALTLLAWNAYASRQGKGRAELPAVGAMSTDGPQPLDPDELARAVATWPPGPRREVVETYLRHLVDLEAAGRARALRQTPLALAATLGQRLPAVLAAATRLAERFGRARWSPEPVAPDEPARARDEAALVRDGPPAGDA